jgi:hypothetical protein
MLLKKLTLVKRKNKYMRNRKIRLQKKLKYVINKSKSNYSFINKTTSDDDNIDVNSEYKIETVEQIKKIDKLISDIINNDSVEITRDRDYCFYIKYCKEFNKNNHKGYVSFDINIYKDNINLNFRKETNNHYESDDYCVYDNTLYLKYEEFLNKLYFNNLKKKGDDILNKIYDNTSLKRKNIIENMFNEI